MHFLVRFRLGRGINLHQRGRHTSFISAQPECRPVLRNPPRHRSLPPLHATTTRCILARATFCTRAKFSSRTTTSDLDLGGQREAPHSRVRPRFTSPSPVEARAGYRDACPSGRRPCGGEGPWLRAGASYYKRSREEEEEEEELRRIWSPASSRK